MTLTELKYLVTLARAKHFGKAAKACHVSQPSLSVAINKLEQELGVYLFERDRQQVRITDVGQKIITQAQRVLDETQLIRDIANDNQSQLERPLRIGAIYTIGPYLFPQLIPVLQKTAPQLQLLIEEDFTHNLREKLSLGEIDVIFIALPFTEANVVTQAIYDEPFLVLMRNDHPLSKKAKINPQDLQNENVLLLGEGHCFRDQVIAACPQCLNPKSALQKTLEGGSLETIRHMVAAGSGITVIPSSAAALNQYQGLLVTKPFAQQSPQRRVALAWRMSFTRPKAITAVLQALKQCSF